MAGHPAAGRSIIAAPAAIAQDIASEPGIDKPAAGGRTLRGTAMESVDGFVRLRGSGRRLIARQIRQATKKAPGFLQVPH